MDNQPKINTTVALLLILLALSGDAADALGLMAQPIPVIGQFLYVLAYIYVKIVWGIIFFYLYWKRIDNKKWFTAGGVIEFIPVLNALPGLIGGVLATIISDRLIAAAKQHPELIGIAARLAGKFEKGGSTAPARTAQSTA